MGEYNRVIWYYQLSWVFNAVWANALTNSERIRPNAWNISFETLLRGPFYVLNSVDNPSIWEALVQIPSNSQLLSGFFFPAVHGFIWFWIRKSDVKSISLRIIDNFAANIANREFRNFLDIAWWNNTRQYTLCRLGVCNTFHERFFSPWSESFFSTLPLVLKWFLLKGGL